LTIEISAWVQAMNNVSRQMHRRAVAVDMAGILFGTLAQASLMGASGWTQPRTPSDPYVAAAHLGYGAGDLERACAASQSRA
jgi:hypothetical protein